MLSEQQLRQREGRLTASRVAALMTGDREKIMNLWREMTGDPEYMPEDLSHVWPVILGSATEQINLDRYEYKTGNPVTRRGEVVIHPQHDWAAATLDGWDDTIPAPIEAKHVGGREALTTVIDRYQPQFHWQGIVTGASQAILSVIEGANEPVRVPVHLDADYAAELWRRAEAFMACVWSLTPPFEVSPVPPPVIPEKIYDMRSSNAWTDAAVTWRNNYPAKKLADAAEKSLKALVPEDAIRCHGAGVQIVRNRAGSLALREATII